MTCIPLRGTESKGIRRAKVFCFGLGHWSYAAARTTKGQRCARSGARTFARRRLDLWAKAAGRWGAGNCGHKQEGPSAGRRRPTRARTCSQPNLFGAALQIGSCHGKPTETDDASAPNDSIACCSPESVRSARFGLDCGSHLTPCMCHGTDTNSLSPDHGKPAPHRRARRQSLRP
jgi:hypothetical protein